MPLCLTRNVCVFVCVYTRNYTTSCGFQIINSEHFILCIISDYLQHKSAKPGCKYKRCLYKMNNNSILTCWLYNSIILLLQYTYTQYPKKNGNKAETCSRILSEWRIVYYFSFCCYMCVCVKHDIPYHANKMGIRAQNDVKDVWC